MDNPRVKWYVGHMGPSRWVLFPYSGSVTESRFKRYFYSVLGPLPNRRDANTIMKRLGGVLIEVKSIRELDTLPARNPGIRYHKRRILEEDRLKGQYPRGSKEYLHHDAKMGAHLESSLQDDGGDDRYHAEQAHGYDVLSELEGSREMQAVWRGYTAGHRERENPCHGGRKRRNPVVRGTKIYDKIQAIDAQKGEDSLWPKENFRHDFKGGGEIWGLENGDLLIKKKKKRLWKNFDY